MASDNRSIQQGAASFRGVKFSVRSESQDSTGKRHIPHDYPNSDRRYIEDNGKILPVFSVTGFIHGKDYLADSRELEEALSTDGPGVLTLPNFGTQTVFAMPYTKSASQNAVGEIAFSMTFQVGTNVSAPSESAPSTESVFAAGDEARTALTLDFQDIYVIPIEKISVETITEDILALKDAVYDSVKEIAEDLKEIADIKGRIEDGVATLVKEGEELANAFFGEIGLMQNVSLEVSPSKIGISAAVNISGVTLTGSASGSI